MKRYLLFAFASHYPGGGWHDYRGDFDTKDEAVRQGEILISIQRLDSDENFHVVDTILGDIISSNYIL